MAARAAAPVRRQRHGGADLRDRLVPAPATGGWLLGYFAGRPSGHVHGRDVRGEPAAAARGALPSSPAARLRTAGDRYWSDWCRGAARDAARRPALHGVGR